MTASAWLGADLPPIYRDGLEYFLVSLDDELFLVRNACPHRGGPLKFGYLNDRGEVVCPMHHNAFPLDQLVRRDSTIRLSETPQGAGQANV